MCNLLNIPKKAKVSNLVVTIRRAADVLRSFLNRVLIKHSAGRTLVYAYDTCSPPVADTVAQGAWLRALVRVRFTRVIGFVSLLV